ncbi:hypothetical protein ACCO45_008824 [Purpureocillium lilacinum]|uniref:Uncharacterized protein n=1 Tax=Purpureocillium lilacinum TaxID=33203 RepID=A0ACC4DIR6_PURLI
MPADARRGVGLPSFCRLPRLLDHAALATLFEMSQDYFSPKGKSPARPDSDTDAPKDAASPPSAVPGYMTVGNGSTSEHAARLAEPTRRGFWLRRERDWRGPSPHNRAGCVGPHLGHGDASRPTPVWRAASDVVQLAARDTRPLHQQGSGAPGTFARDERVLAGALPLCPTSRHLFVFRAALVPPRPQPCALDDGRRTGRIRYGRPPPVLRRSMTSLENASAESSRAAENRSIPEPRLVSPQIAQEFSILKLDLKLGALHQAELVHSLEKGSIASLLDGKISSSIKHLLSLRERIEDTSSKVLITGDLNAGKSTFCNALLRRKVLPEDQQPCTAIFCEDATYSRNDESTYDVFSLNELEKIVTDNETYTQCKVYVKDVRTIDESLLNNGVVDIALIDAPGLNSDTTKTTAIFARQEEIDVVVFVVSAANHFTQSAKEFIWAAAAEKAYIFIVVNGYDTIKDKDRCQKLILDQVAGLSPRTHKESSELVHFVSSNAIPAGPSPPGGPGGSGGASGSSSGGGDDPGDDGGKGKGKDMDKVRDFEALEQSLRRFVLEKRARSKLAPARTYLLNILNDVNTLATVNQEVAQSEMERVTRELKELEPQLESSRKARSEVGEQIDHNIEDTCKEVYDHTRAELNQAIGQAGRTNYDVPYPGFLGAFQYAEDLKEAMLSHIGDAVTNCEEHARSRTVKGVNAIKQLGLLHVGDEFQNLQFRPDVMFRRKRDALARQVDIHTELWDFVDWSTLCSARRSLREQAWLSQLPALTATRVLSNDNLRQLILPGIVIAAVAASAYILQQIPNSLPPRLATKISTQLEELDYVHANSSRISSSVRKVLRFPADNLRVGLDQSVKDLGTRRDETVKVKAESERASKFFRTLVGESEVQRSMVEGVDLDAPPPACTE